MYAVAPGVEAQWRGLLNHIAEDAGVPLHYMSYPAPEPLERLWARPDLGAVFMCGFPFMLRLAPVQLIAAPIPDLPWAQGRPVYRSDLIVRRDAPYRTLEDTFGGRSAWTVTHSHSGFNAWRHHLLAYRTAQRPALYAHMQGELITARRVLDAVHTGQIDIGPLDAYWHALIARHVPELVSGIRVLDSTPLAPMPAFVAAADAPAEQVARLRAAFEAASSRSWFAPYASELMLRGFAAVTEDAYRTLLDRDREAKAAGYALPA